MNHISVCVSRSSEQKKSTLEGMKILIVEDQRIQRMLAEKCVTRLGAEVEMCENGKEAFDVVCKALRKLSNGGPSKFPYDCILMDCQVIIIKLINIQMLDVLIYEN